MRLELRHLRVVCAIADAGSVTKAAAVLGLAAPALTTQLQRIERAFGGQLFERDRRGARPTPLGELVLARARVLLPAVQGLQDEATRFAGLAQDAGGDGLPGYRIGAVNGPLIGGVVHRLAAAQPSAQLSTYPSWSSAELAAMLADARLDFALIGTCGEATPPDDGRLVWHTVATAPVFVLLPASHPYADADEVELADLAGSRWAATPGDGCFADCFAAACARAGFTPSPIHESDLGGCSDLVRGGSVVALCQPTFREIAGVRAVPLTDTPLRWRHLIGWHPDSPAARVAPRLIHYAEESYADAIRLSPGYTRWLTHHPDPTPSR
ncbi:LysR family transcriptional regulator [Catellatospora vulcania]|uniref:LysR family transcriptional regulator n=1 Tax=Catellatospora vulcania TaxID=1460450 RepID=UPI0012D43BD0|nr:LysR family transcriptional regulator [Catellatospora vulcania]